jgi:hypothetical protein
MLHLFDDLWLDKIIPKNKDRRQSHIWKSREYGSLHVWYKTWLINNYIKSKKVRYGFTKCFFVYQHRQVLATVDLIILRIWPSNNNCLNVPISINNNKRNKFVYKFCSFSFGHCVVCPSSIYVFWLPLWYLDTLLSTKQYLHSNTVWLAFLKDISIQM